MKRVIFLFLLATIFVVPVFAQRTKPQSSALMINSVAWQGADSDKLLNDPVIKTRLKKLLGKKNYAAFMSSFQTVNPIEKRGTILFSGGCLIHACSHLESAIAIDLAADTIHAAIYDDVKKTLYFNERGSRTPPPIRNWAKRLESNKAQ